MYNLNMISGGVYYTLTDQFPATEFNFQMPLLGQGIASSLSTADYSITICAVATDQYEAQT